MIILPAQVDPFGCHFVGCRIDAHAIRLHDNVVHKLMNLLRPLGLVVSLEPIRLFANVQSDDIRRPDTIVRNPYGSGPQIILDVAVTGVNGQPRRSDLDTDQSLHYRFNQPEEG